ncbi:PLP-dependent cysteine synthase family protein [Photobacterium minamisatsumaniensis]|uniref:PLP-dependent cysteine synthase family protein n=1 Tax=Photobacterium minamisatsumaniensis TaxID=2910233 RepID=UPI003D0D49BE
MSSNLRLVKAVNATNNSIEVAMIRNSILECIGNTPLIRLSSVSSRYDCDVYIKMESLNPGGSHKARIALNMIEKAEQQGVLVPHSGQTIIEPSGGNTGLGLVMAANLKGYKVVLVIPDNYSVKKQKLLKLYGAQVVNSDATQGNNSHGELALELTLKNPDYVMLNQQRNPANPDTHVKYTSQEILRQLPNTVSLDYMIAGIGTGGHISGISKVLKEAYPELTIVGVEPEGCALLEDIHSPHQIQGLSVGIIPQTLDVTVLNHMVNVDFEDCVQVIHRTVREESIALGISSAANLVAIDKLSQQFDLAGKRILTFCYDSVDSYLEQLKLELN